jgi:hypothetical protein
MVGNPGTDSAQVEIYIDGQKTNDSPYTIPAGQVWHPKYDDVVGGPVQVVSTDGQPIYATQRVVWNGSSFNETIGVPRSLLATDKSLVYLPIVLKY